MMPRIRTVKPDLYRHIGLYNAEKESRLPLRLAFIALFSCCDRRGRFEWEPNCLKVTIFPFDDDLEIGQVLDALVIYGFVKKYVYQGQVYGCIPSWAEHQKIGNREKESRLPALEESQLLAVLQTQNSIANNPNLDCTQTQNTDCSQPKLQILPIQITDAFEEGKGRERKGRERKGSNVALKTRPFALENTLTQVFNHWKTVMDHPNAMLDPKRQALIRKALQLGYNGEQLCEAITGCSLTPHNIGDNDRGQRYDGLHVILRDCDQIDRFIHNCHYPPRSMTGAEQKTNANVQTLQQWANQKMAEVSANGNA